MIVYHCMGDDKSVCLCVCSHASVSASHVENVAIRSFFCLIDSQLFPPI